MCIPPIVARQRLGKVHFSFQCQATARKHAPAATNTRNDRRIAGRVSVDPHIVAR
jgi:hypothetical protein